MDRPEPGDRILILKPYWLNLILSGQKSMEIRSRNLKPGQYWLGGRGFVHGYVQLKPGFLIDTIEACLAS